MEEETYVYTHKAQYYETDQMGIIHHSNYIRWFEEARIDWMASIGMDYTQMEQEGIISPVLAVNCEYKSMVRFGETVVIVPRIKLYNGVKLEIEYTITDQMSGQLRVKGETRHCFLTKEQKPLSLKRSYPIWDEVLRDRLQLG